MASACTFDDEPVRFFKSFSIRIYDTYLVERVFGLLKQMCIGEWPTNGAEVIEDFFFIENVQQLQGWLFKTEGLSVVITFKNLFSIPQVEELIKEEISCDSKIFVLPCDCGKEHLSVFPTTKNQFREYINYNDIRQSLYEFDAVQLDAIDD